MSWLRNLKTPVIFCIVLILSIFQSCDIIDSNKLEKFPIEGNILFCAQKVQSTGNSSPYEKIMIFIRTEQEYSHANYEIKAKVSRHYNQITIALLYIEIPSILLPAFGPAYTKVFFNLAEGDYSLNIYANEVTDKYGLSVNDSSVIITEIESHFTLQSANCTVLQ